MTSDELGLLAAICRDPGDDVVRLAYADEIEGAGDPTRAKLIRFQCGHPGVAMPRDEFKLAARAEFRRLIKTSAWPGHSMYGSAVSIHYQSRVATRIRYTSLANRSDLSDNPPNRVKMVLARGFIDSLTCTAADFLRVADDLLKSQPVTRVRLTMCDERIYKLELVANDAADPSKGYTSPRWPGVAFELPAVEWRNYTTEYTEFTRASLEERMRRALLATTLRPPVETTRAAIEAVVRRETSAAETIRCVTAPNGWQAARDPFLWEINHVCPPSYLSDLIDRLTTARVEMRPWRMVDVVPTVARGRCEACRTTFLADGR